MADAPSSAAGTDGVSAGRRKAVVGTLLLATVMASLDSSFAPIAFPDMIDDLDTSTAVVVWVALGYLIAATGPMLFMARVADSYSRALLFKTGITVYSVAMAACTYAPDIDTLIGLRAVQGFGMAMFLPTTFTLATEVYDPKERGKALGLMAMANAFGFVLGPVFAGWLLDAYDWRSLFEVRIPVAAVVVALAWAVLGPVGSARHRRSYYDAAGAVFLTLALFGLLFGFNRLPVEDNHQELWVWSMFAGGFVFLWLFLRQERLSPDPLVDLDLFRERMQFTKASMAFAALFASMPVYLFVLPLLLIAGMEMRAWDVGMIMAVAALFTTLTATYAGRLADRRGPFIPCLIGTGFTLAGYLAFIAITLDGSLYMLLLAMAFVGLGIGFFTSPNNALIMSDVPPERQGMSSGLIGTVRQTGYAIGFAIIASLVTAIQDNLEEVWAVFALAPIPVEAALKASHFYEEGSIWSPEVLLYVFRITAIICASLTLLMFVNSMPTLKMTLKRHLASVAATIAIALTGTFVFASMSPLTPYAQGTVVSDVRLEIAPFGMASRAKTVRVETTLAGADAPLMTFIDNCATCHGDDAAGLIEDGYLYGVDLKDNSFIKGLTDDALKAFIISGRMEDEPGNRTGKMMPGFDYLEPQDFDNLVTFLRSVNR